MWTLMLGVVLVLLKWLEVAPVVAWSWWWVLSPFAVTIAWWSWADSSGYSKRKEIEKIDKRRTDRLDRYREELGNIKRK